MRICATLTTLTLAFVCGSCAEDAVRSLRAARPSVEKSEPVRRLTPDEALSRVLRQGMTQGEAVAAIHGQFLTTVPVASIAFCEVLYVAPGFEGGRIELAFSLIRAFDGNLVFVLRDWRFQTWEQLQTAQAAQAAQADSESRWHIGGRQPDPSISREIEEEWTYHDHRTPPPPR